MKSARLQYTEAMRRYELRILLSFHGEISSRIPVRSQWGSFAGLFVQALQTEALAKVWLRLCKPKLQRRLGSCEDVFHFSCTEYRIPITDYRVPITEYLELLSRVPLRGIWLRRARLRLGSSPGSLRSRDFVALLLKLRSSIFNLWSWVFCLVSFLSPPFALRLRPTLPAPRPLLPTILPGVGCRDLV